MARIRTIKPEIWTDEKLGTCSILARLNFKGLISLADDEGRGRGSVRGLLSGLHGFTRDVTEEAMDNALGELEAAGMVVFYTIGGQRYYFVKNFAKHQKIDRPSPSKLPPPPEPSTTANRRHTEDSSSHRPRKGMEGKGMERSGTEVERSGVDQEGAAGSPSATAQGDRPGGGDEDWSANSIRREMGLDEGAELPARKRLSPEELERRRAAMKAQAEQAAEVDSASTAGGERRA